MSTGADGEERAIALDGDAVVFAVDTPDPALVGVAVRSAAGRFVTFVRSHPDGRVQDVTVAAWKPDMAGALAALPAPLPTDNQHLVRLAERSEERRVGKECVRTCSSWWWPDH